MHGWTSGVLLLLLGAGAQQSDTESKYRVPDQALVDIVDTPATPRVSIGPNRDWMLLLEQPNLPPIAELAEEELRLAGMRINPRNFGRTRTRPASGLRLREMATGKEVAVEGLPEKPRIQHVRWAPDGRHLLFTHATADRIDLWVVETQTASARRISERRLNLAAGVNPDWLSDGQTILCATVPAELGPRPPRSAVPEGPVIQQTSGKTAPARTYQDLLKDGVDEEIFEYLVTSQLTLMGLDGSEETLGESRLLWDVSSSPDGRYLLVEALEKPFSYLVPASRFPLRVELWDRAGQMVRRLADLPLQEEIPVAFGSVATGPRSFRWRSDSPATLCWVEALDGGDASKEAEERDRLFLLSAPFKGDPTPWLTLGLRFGGVTFGTDEVALVSEYWWQTRKTRTWVAPPGSPETAASLLFDYSYEDRYNDPGRPLTEPNMWGRSVLLRSIDGESIFLVGSGASHAGDRPFLDRLHLGSKETERLFRSEPPYYESVVEFLDEEQKVVITRRESVDEPPNYFARKLESGALESITEFPHPTPELKGIQKKLIRYQRGDGVMLTGTLYLPRDYTPEQGPLPTLLWAYPREFKSAAAAAQVRGSPHRFNRVSPYAAMLWVIQGYAVLDGPTMPIIGEGDAEPNDTYVEQLVASAKAACNELVRRGVSAAGRFAIGGHSYGAFMTANLLAHSDLFAAGIARSGAYNRTLTPFGFQAEQRTFWEAPEVYFAMSPFMHADKLNEPILLIHGEADNNSGTFPMQSKRFYSAIKGHGGNARLVMLPLESHGYRSRESILHMLWETQEWLQRFVKNASLETAASE